MDDAEDVAEDDQRHEERAFADDNLGAERFGDGDRPAHREAEQE